jgi:hypothetical protein
VAVKFDFTTEPNGDQAIVVEVTSATGTINERDGPIAAIFVRLADTVVAGDEYELQLDVANTSVLDQNGAPVPIRPRPGRLRILGAGDPFELEAESDPVAPGELALLEVDTSEALPLSAATFILHYDPSLAAGLPTAVVPPQHGNATLQVEHGSGVITIDVTSADASLNEVPGGIVQVRLPLRTDLVPNLDAPIWLDPETVAFDASGDPVATALEDGVLEVWHLPLFADDLETGDAVCWN